MTALLEDLPPNSHLEVDALFAEAGDPAGWSRGGLAATNEAVTAYLHLAPGASPDMVTPKLDAALARHV